MSRAQLTSTVEQSSGGVVTPFLAGKNKIINGDFGIWARGTSFNPTGSGTYFADRWVSNGSAGSGTSTYSQQAFTPGSAPVAGYEAPYFARLATTGANSSTQLGLSQRIENVQTLAGQTATLSFWAKADSARTLSILFDQNFGSGGSSDVFSSGSTVSITTSWVRYSVTYSVPSISGKTIGSGSYFAFYLYLVAGSLSGNANLDIWGVQLEAGSVATPFSTASGTVQGELALCQRYYYRAMAATPYAWLGFGMAYSTTAGLMVVNMPVTMRANPSSIDYSAMTVSTGTGSPTVSSMSINQSGLNSILLAFVSSGLTAYSPYGLQVSNNSSGYVGINAEL